MKGVQDFGSLEAIIMGINAGLDMFIFREADKNTVETINELVKIAEQDSSLREKIINSQKRICNLKESYKVLV